MVESELSKHNVANIFCMNSMVGLHSDVNTMLIHSFMQHSLSVSEEYDFDHLGT